MHHLYLDFAAYELPHMYRNSLKGSYTNLQKNIPFRQRIYTDKTDYTMDLNRKINKSINKMWFKTHLPAQQ